MADQNQKPGEQKPVEAKAPYVAKHKIIGSVGGKRREFRAGEILQLTDAEAKALGDAVELKR